MNTNCRRLRGQWNAIYYWIKTCGVESGRDDDDDDEEITNSNDEYTIFCVLYSSLSFLEKMNENMKSNKMEWEEYGTNARCTLLLILFIESLCSFGAPIFERYMVYRFTLYDTSCEVVPSMWISCSSEIVSVGIFAVQLPPLVFRSQIIMKIHASSINCKFARTRSTERLYASNFIIPTKIEWFIMKSLEIACAFVHPSSVHTVLLSRKHTRTDTLDRTAACGSWLNHNIWSLDYAVNSARKCPCEWLMSALMLHHFAVNISEAWAKSWFIEPNDEHCMAASDTFLETTCHIQFCHTPDWLLQIFMLLQCHRQYWLECASIVSRLAEFEKFCVIFCFTFSSNLTHGPDWKSKRIVRRSRRLSVAQNASEFCERCKSIAASTLNKHVPFPSPPSSSVAGSFFFFLANIPVIRCIDLIKDNTLTGTSIPRTLHSWVWIFRCNYIENQ